MDAISQSLTFIRNANCNRNRTVQLPLVSTNYQLVSLLKQEGFIESFTIRKVGIVVQLKYKGKTKLPLLTNLKRISTPGRRVYMNQKHIPDLFGGLGLFVISSSKGLITNKQAKEYKIGGELICAIW